MLTVDCSIRTNDCCDILLKYYFCPSSSIHTYTVTNNTITQLYLYHYPTTNCGVLLYSISSLPVVGFFLKIHPPVEKFQPPSLQSVSLHQPHCLNLNTSFRSLAQAEYKTTNSITHLSVSVSGISVLCMSWLVLVLQQNVLLTKVHQSSVILCCSICRQISSFVLTFKNDQTKLVQIHIPYTAKYSRGITFTVGIENEFSWEHFRGSSTF